jgi:hypothetical protein
VKRDSEVLPTQCRDGRGGDPLPSNAARCSLRLPPRPFPSPIACPESMMAPGCLLWLPAMCNAHRSGDLWRRRLRSCDAGGGWWHHPPRTQPLHLRIPVRGRHPRARTRPGERVCRAISTQSCWRCPPMLPTRLRHWKNSTVLWLLVRMGRRHDVDAAALWQSLACCSPLALVVLLRACVACAGGQR